MQKMFRGFALTFALCSALAIGFGPTIAQQTKSQLNTEVGANFPDNTSGLITPLLLRTTINDIIASFQQAPSVNAQVSSPYTFVVSDFGKLVTFSASPTSVTLPQATGSFSNFNVFVKNVGGGIVTVSPTVSTIDGVSSLPIAAGATAWIVSNGTNYVSYAGSGGGGGGGSTTVICGDGLSGGTITAAGTCALYFDQDSIADCSLSSSVGSNNLTISLLTQDGSTPSAGKPCFVSFRSATAATGNYTVRKVTSATTLVFNAGSTLGTTSNVPFRVWVEVFDNGSTAVLGASVQSNTTSIFPLNESVLQTTTACSACTSATSAGVFYTTVAQTSKPWRAFGFLTWEAGVPTAGNWSADATEKHLVTRGTPLPGQVIQSVQASTATTVTNTTTSFMDTNCTAPIVPTSAANYVSSTWSTDGQTAAAGDVGVIAMRRGGTVVDRQRLLFSAGGGLIATAGSTWVDAPGSAGSLTYTLAIRVFTATNSLTVPNSLGGCVVSLQEIMG